MVVHGRPKTPKNTSFLGSPSPQGSQSLYILGDTTRPGHVTCVLVWSKSDRRRLRKTLHKQTDKQTDTTKIMVIWPWTNKQIVAWISWSISHLFTLNLHLQDEMWNVNYSGKSYCPIFQSGNYHFPSPMERSNRRLLSTNLWSITRRNDDCVSVWLGTF